MKSNEIASTRKLRKFCLAENPIRSSPSAFESFQEFPAKRARIGDEQFTRIAMRVPAHFTR